MMRLSKKIIIILLFSQLLLNSVYSQSVAEEQEEKPAPMRNVFLNTLWGSVAGGLLKISLVVANSEGDASTRFSFVNMSTHFFLGATIGGLTGLVTGYYLSLNGYIFQNNDYLNRVEFIPDPSMKNQDVEDIKNFKFITSIKLLDLKF